MTCPSFEQFLAWKRDQLPAEETERINQHLCTGCETCRNELDLVQRVLTTAVSRELIHPPHWLIRQAMNLFAEEKAARRENPFKRILAFLVFDQFAPVPSLGFRRGGPQARQMVYRAGDYNVNLSIRSPGRTQVVEIMGQAVPLSGDFSTVAEAQVALWQATRAVHATTVNQHGSFILDGIAEGIYDMRIKLADEEIEIIGFKAVACPDRRGPVN